MLPMDIEVAGTFLEAVGGVALVCRNMDSYATTNDIAFPVAHKHGILDLKHA